MSILSDSELLLNHIKNSFIFGDDTGICELIIEKEFPTNFNIQDILNNELNYPIVDTTSQAFRSSSPEISTNSNKVAIRNFSEAKANDVEQKELKAPINHQIIDINEWPRILTEQDVNELFNTAKVDQPSKCKTSLLSKMLEETNLTDVVSFNIFANYAKFSALRYMKSVGPNSTGVITNQIVVGENDPNKPLRDFSIYFWDFEEQRNRSNPVIVRPISETKVSDLVGLACWKYVEEKRSPALSNQLIVNKMQLYMFEDMEDLEFGFGSLNATDPIYKYKFSHLALLESQANGRSKFVSICSTASNNSFVTRSYLEKMGLQTHSIDIENVPDQNSIGNSNDTGKGLIKVQIQLAHGISTYEFTADTTVDQIIKHTINKRQLLQHGENYKYRLELASESGKELGLNVILGQIENPSFVLVRDLSRRKPAIPDLINEETSNMFSEMIDSMQPQQYNVQLKQPLKRWEALLRISPDIIEIEAILGKLPFRIKSKSIRIPFPFMADCEINFHGQTQPNSSNKVTIKLIHLKKKSALAKNLKESLEMDHSVPDSETISLKSPIRQDVNSQTDELSTNDLLSELTSHSISCSSSVGKLICNQIVTIMDFKSHFIRKEYLTLLH